MPECRWIEPGRLLVGEHPAGARVEETRARLEALLGAGVSYFIDLCGMAERPPYDHFLPPARADLDRYVIYVRKALPERGVAPSPAAMAEILDYLGSALEVGHCVYLHGAAGIVRTQMVAGCWLRRTGLSGEAAVARLLGAGRADSSAPTTSPESADESLRRFIEGWSEPPPGDAVSDWPVDLESIALLRGRFLGALVGLACGDAMGATTQFLKVGQFAPVAGLVGGGRWQLPPGAWTDDTAMSLCLAESLIARATFDPADFRARLRLWSQQGQPSSTGQCVGITAAVAAALREESTAAAPAGALVAAGAHAVTRAGVVALFAAAHPQQAFAWAAAAARTTDPSIAVGNAAMVYAALVLAALRGVTGSELIATARGLWAESARAPVGIFDVALGTAGRSPAAEEVIESGSSDPFAVLRTVLAAVTRSEGFRDGLIALVNRGGDADVQGALFGQLAGVLHGLPAIPAAWRAGLVHRTRIEDLADRLLAAAITPGS